MQVGDGFSSVAPVVDDETEAFGNFVHAEFAGNFSGSEEEGSEMSLVFRGGFTDAEDDFFGDDQDMDRSLRGDVAEGEGLVIFVNDVRRDLSGDDFFEEGHKGGFLVSAMQIYLV